VESIDGGYNVNLAELSKQIGIDLTAMDADDLEVVEGSYDFKLFTRDHEGNGSVVKAYEEKAEGQDDPDFIIEGVASSTIRDLHGDTMLPSAIIDMERAAKDNLTIYLNHKYTVPEDIAGSCRDAKIVSTATDAAGAPIYDLMFKTRVDKTNPRAVQTFKSLQGGTKLGMSIGANIPEGGAIRNKKTGALLIAHVDLLETSVVAIPANPRSWIDSATRAVKSGIRSARSSQITLGEDGPEVVAPVVVLATTPAEPVAAEPIVPVDNTAEAGDPAVNNDTTPSQEAPQSAPDDGGSATEQVIAAATDVLERTGDPAVTGDLYRTLLEAHNALATVTESLIDERAKRAEVEAQLATRTAERDQAKETSVNVVNEVANLIDQLSRLPAGRQASFRRIQEDFADLESAYPAEFIRQLRSIGKE